MTNYEILINEMAKKIVTFQYKKKDGSIRTAKGTTNLDSIRKEYDFKAGDGPSRYGYASYWDVEKGNWRCFDPSMLISAEGLF